MRMQGWRNYRQVCKVSEVFLSILVSSYMKIPLGFPAALRGSEMALDVFECNHKYI